MTQNENSVVDRVRGYIDAKKEARADQVFSDRAIMALNMAYIILEKEICFLENEKKQDAMEIDSLSKKLKEKTYPIDREYLLIKERDKYKEIADLQRMSLRFLTDELNRTNDKIGLQILEIGKLGGLLKEADDCIVFYRNTTGVEPKDIKLYSDGSTVDQVECMVKIHELFRELRGDKNGKK